MTHTQIPFYQRLTCNVEEACQASSLSRAKLFEVMAEGRLKSTKVDRRRIIHVSSLKALLGVTDDPPVAAKVGGT
jgi:hypothetical protein